MDDNLFNFSSFLRALGSYRPLSVALERLIIGTVVFWVVRFLRGTRGARMLQGIAFLLFIFYLIVALVGKQFGLDRLVFLYGQFLQFGSLAILIVFQPELRRAIMRQIGRASCRERV